MFVSSWFKTSKLFWALKPFESTNSHFQRSVFLKAVVSNVRLDPVGAFSKTVSQEYKQSKKIQIFLVGSNIQEQTIEENSDQHLT